MPRKIGFQARLARISRRSIRNLVSALPQRYRDPCLRALLRANLRPPPELTVKLVQSRSELESALKLLHDTYVSEGYMTPVPSGIRLSRYHALPTTQTIIALWDGVVVGTMSVIGDSRFGVPADKIFDISPFRKKNLSIAEPSGLAVHREFQGSRNSAVLFSLFRYLVHYTQDRLRNDVWVVAVNPKHAELYESILCFKRLAASNARYDYVNGAPAIGLYRDLRTWESEMALAYAGMPIEKDVYRFFFKTQIPDLISPWILSPETIDYFFNQKTTLFSELGGDWRKAA